MSPDRVARGLPTGGQGSKVYVLCAEPEEHKRFRPGTRPGGSGTRPEGSVTGVTEKLFMCQMVYVTVGFLYGAGAETLIFVTGTSGKKAKLFVSRQKSQSQLWIPRKPRKIGVWVSTAEKFSKIVLGKTRNFSRKFRV